MDRTDAHRWLSETVKATTPPALTPEDLDGFLDAARVLDRYGNPPADEDYVETFDLNYAAADAFEAKAVASLAGDTGGVESFTSEGSAFKRRAGTSYDGFMALAERFRARSAVGGSSIISVIELQREGRTVPRSVRHVD